MVLIDDLLLGPLDHPSLGKHVPFPISSLSLLLLDDVQPYAVESVPNYRRDYLALLDGPQDL
jgi:hypothetical protein